jgi:hypothetical protein
MFRRGSNGISLLLYIERCIGSNCFSTISLELVNLEEKVDYVSWVGTRGLQTSFLPPTELRSNLLRCAIVIHLSLVKQSVCVLFFFGGI